LRTVHEPAVERSTLVRFRPLRGNKEISKSVSMAVFVKATDMSPRLARVCQMMPCVIIRRAAARSRKVSKVFL
jgi:hypothetical protein